MDNAYLCHHGIKGMKWGVRRTPEQLGRLAQTVERGKKGYKVQRYSGYKTRDIPTYVYSDLDDSKHYARNAYNLPSVKKGRASLTVNPFAFNLNDIIKKTVKKATLSTYTLNKDAKIAEAEDVLSQVMKRIGQMPAEHVISMIDADDYTLSDYFYSIDAKQRRQMTYAQLNKRMHKDNKLTANDRQYIAKQVISANTHDTMEDVKNYFKKRGYDILVDPEDVANGFKDPWIVLNPDVLTKQMSSDLTLKSIKKYGSS